MRIAGLVALSSFLALASPASAEIVIGVAGPMTGSFAVLGAQMKAGAERAVADLNAAGGVLGETVTLAVGDDLCDRKQADAVANQMAGRRIVFMAGHLCTSASVAAATVYTENHIVDISPGAAGPEFTDQRAGPGIFRLAGRTDAEGPAIAALLAGRFAGKRIALVHDDSAYGKALSDDVAKALSGGGIKVAFNDTYQSGGKDYSALVSRLKDARTDVLVLAGYPAEAGPIVIEMRRQALAATMVGGDALIGNDFWQAAGDAGEGTLVAYPPDPEANPAAAAAVAAFRAAGVEPAGLILPTYAAVQIWSRAAIRSGSADAAAVAAAIAAGSFDTVLGTVSFDAKGDARLPAFVIYQWKAGRPVPLEK